MSTNAKTDDFGSLFKKYRLRSEIETLSEFGDLLADEGYIYETSLFTRWQKGERMPKDRDVLLATLIVFAKNNGITTLSEANEFMQSANQRALSFDEADELSLYFQEGRMQTLPACPHLFVGKKQLLKESTWELLQGNNISLSGLPGSGKTYTSLVLAHKLKDHFRDGIYWYRADVKDPMGVIDNILIDLRYPLQGFASLDQKVKKLQSLLNGKKVLLILDNLNEGVDEYLEDLSKIPMVIIVTTVASSKRTDIKEFGVTPFTPEEYHEVCVRILGKPFVDMNEEKLVRLGIALGMLPILTVISLKQIYQVPKEFDEYLKKVEAVGILNSEYDGKNLNEVLSMVINKLPPRLNKVLEICAVFEGGDFSSKIVAQVMQVSQKTLVNELRELMSSSLVEESVKGRFRLHPVVREFVKKRIGREIYNLTFEYFERTLAIYSDGSKEYTEQLHKEFDNAIGFFRNMIHFREYHNSAKIWANIRTYAFICGYWEQITSNRQNIELMYEKLGDKKSYALYLTADLGRVLFFQKKIVEVKELIEIAYKIALESNDENILGLIRQKVGATQMAEGKYTASINSFRMAIENIDHKSHGDQIIKTYTYIAEALVMVNNKQEAIKYSKLAAKKIENLTDLSVKSYIYIQLGKIYLTLDNLQTAEAFFNKGYAIAKKLNVLIGKALALEGLAKIAESKNEISTYKRLLSRANEIYRELQMR